jgi:hypothetical protein
MNKKRKASGRVPHPALLSPQRSIVLLDPKSELVAVTANKAKKNGGGVVTLNPFLVLPSLEKLRGKWFRLGIEAAIKDHIKVQRKEGNERQQQRKSQRAH